VSSIKPVGINARIVTIVAAIGLSVFLSSCLNSGGSDPAGTAGSSPASSSVAACAASVGGAITVAVTPSRVLGVAPLAVFFDTTGTSATTTTRPFHDLEYRWDFNDPTSGNWGDRTTGGNGTGTNTSRNSARGPVAAHVFETPGTYNVALTVTDGTSTATGCVIPITVQDPDVVFAGANTICIGAVTDPTPGVTPGCPATAAHAMQPDFPTVLSTYATTGKRVLLKRGEIWTGSAVGQSILVAGPGIIGAFGAGAAPVIRSTSVTNFTSLLRFSGAASDWRIMDLDLDGESDPHRNGIFINGPASQITLLRLNIHHVGGGIEATAGAGNLDQNALVDSTIAHLNGLTVPGSATDHGYGAYGSRHMVLGNSISDGVNSSHQVRIHYADRGVFSSNTFTGSSTITEVLTLRAPRFDAGVSVAYLNNATTNKVVLSDNKYVLDGGPISFKEFTGGCNCKIFDVISERNWYSLVPGANTGITLSIANAADVTIRNEIMDLTDNNVSNNLGIGIGTGGGAEQVPNNINIYNNSIYSPDANPSFRGVALAANVTNINIKNNLAYAPNSGGGELIVGGTGASGIVKSNNSTDSTGSNQIHNTNPGWTIAGAMPPANFKAGGYAIGGGATAPKVPVFSDFFLTSTPASPNMGAANP
jgi:hypothetical protein